MAEQSPVELSARELEILELVVTGATNLQIAYQLSISVNTVKAHLRNIFSKLNVESRTEATLYAIQHRLVQVAPPPSVPPETTAREPAPLPTMRPQDWPLMPAPTVILVLILFLILAVGFWPDVTANPLAEESRLVDLPAQPSAQVEVTTSSRWQNKAQMPTPRGRFAQAEVGGLIYVIGGLSDAGWSHDVEVYDPLEDRWDRRADKPTAVANVGAVAVRGHIYVPGGLNADNRPTAMLEVYDPTGDRWFAASSLPVPLCAYAIAPYEEGFYLFGGWDGQRYLETVYHYDAGQDTWDEQAPMGAGRGFATATTVGERIYLVGGYDGDTEYRLCESYTPSLAAAGQDPWQTHAPMSMGRAGHAMALSQGSLYVVGGGWDTSYLAYSERYDTAKDAWSTFESPIIGQWRTLGLSTVAGREGNFLYAIGGWNKRYLGVVQAYQAFYRLFLP